MFLSLRCFGVSWGSINIDKQTMAAMTAAYASEAFAEALNDESVQKMLEHYTSAEVATAGIFASKWLDRKAIQNAGLFDSAEENYYYRRIYWMVSTRIMPKILDVAALMVKHPEKAIYWGPYLFKVCEQTKQLCMTFEVVVTNHKLSFQDITFLAINDNLRDLFDLTRFGSVDWERVWDQLVDFGSDITKEDLMEDLEGLMSAGSAIASAGGSILSDAWVDSKHVGNVFHMKPGEIVQLYDDFKQIYETFGDPVNFQRLLMNRIHSNDSINVSSLFTFSGYNITSYISDYLQEFQGRYYTQRWYIYWSDNGSQQVCSYTPPMDYQSICYSPEWYRVRYTRRNYAYTNDDYEQSLRNSESYAGWSRAQCNALNSKNDGSFYEFQNSIITSQVVNQRTGVVTYWSFAHNINVYKTWDSEGVVYEEFFDSQYDDLQDFQARFNLKLQEFNAKGDGHIYYLGKGEKRYYDAADESKVRNCTTVSYAMTCHDNAKLAEGNFSWKENGDQSTCLNEDSKRFAMESTLSDSPDTSEADSEIARLTDNIRDLRYKISLRKNRNNKLLEQISTASVEEAAALREKYNTNLAEIAAFEAELRETQALLDELKEAKQALLEDYEDERDGTYRIPAAMHDVESAYDIIWSDAGRWVSFSRDLAVFERRGNVPDINGEVVFRAELRPERQESHNWLIGRYHRAILGVSWTLSANYSNSEIVDFLQLDNNLTDSEKSRQANDRLHELQRENPGCDIEMNYAYSAPPDIEDDEDAVHLLWACDRLAVARDVDYRLSKIYAQLVLIEKYLRSRETLEDYLRRAMGMTVANTVNRYRIGNKSFRRWHRSATAAATGENIADVLAAMDDEEE